MSKSFGIDLSKVPEKDNNMSEKEMQKTQKFLASKFDVSKIPEKSKDAERIQKIAKEGNEKSDSYEGTQSALNAKFDLLQEKRLSKEDWIKKTKQEKRMKGLQERGMLNSFEDGVSGDPDYDFDEFD